MLKLWDLDDIFEMLFDQMKNMPEIEKQLMEPILLKGLHRYFSPNCELILDVKMKYWYFGKKQKKLKTETGTPFLTEL